MVSELTLYGISNCEKVRAARKWLDVHGLPYRFWDVRKEGIEVKKLQQWLEHVDLKTLVNTRSTTWRQLDDATREAIRAGDLALLAGHPTLIKRPVLEGKGRVLVGFDPMVWEGVLL